MSIPDYQSLMYPILKIVQERSEVHIKEILLILKDRFDLTEEEMLEMLPSGKQTYMKNRTGWAITYMKKAGLILSNKGVATLTPRGKELVHDRSITELNNSFLMKYPEFVEFKRSTKSEQASEETFVQSANDKTPMEQLFTLYTELKNELALELLDTIKNCTPSFFEKLVVDLLVSMGYGGSVADAGKSVGKSGDGGIDGIIKEDHLGLDVIYLQAKRWENVVGRPEIQKFVGALHGQRARKGVFITSSHFTKEAMDYVSFIENKIVLIDGIHLANLMIDFNLGVSKAEVFEVKKIDRDYFEND